MEEEDRCLDLLYDTCCVRLPPMCAMFTFYSLEGNMIGDVGAAAIGEALRANKALRSLKLVERSKKSSVLSNTHLLYASFALSLSRIPHYSLQGNVVKDKGVVALAGALRHNKTLAMLKSVRQSRSIRRRLSVLSAAITRPSPVSFPSSLRSVRFNFFHAKGAAAIGELLRYSTTLTELK